MGRIPYLVPMKWEDGWPVIGVDGKVPLTLDLPPSKGLIPGIVASDEFERKPGDRPLPLVWQWNHNPDNKLWSLSARPGHLRLTTVRVDKDIEAARNTLTQRTIGPECSGTTAVDVSHLKDGDFAGLVLFAKTTALWAWKADDGTNYLVMVSAENIRRSRSNACRSSNRPFTSKWIAISTTARIGRDSITALMGSRGSPSVVRSR